MNVYYAESDALKINTFYRAYILSNDRESAINEFCIRYGISKYEISRCTQVSDGEEIIIEGVTNVRNKGGALALWKRRRKV